VTPFAISDVSAAILAGGEGRRVDGRDKGLLPLAGKPLIAHVTAALTAQAGRVLVCANRNANEYAGFGTVIGDALAGFHGPLAGIAAALSACRTPWLLTVPVDGPDLPLDLFVRLYATVARTAATAAVAHDGARRQPLFALYRTQLAASATAALHGDLPVWRWQDEVGAAQADFSDVPQAFANLNTLDEFHRWEQRHAG
jgi:molybdopterin-guanine dinucleotide biosynthesis protein A